MRLFICLLASGNAIKKIEEKKKSSASVSLIDNLFIFYWDISIDTHATNPPAVLSGQCSAAWSAARMSNEKKNQEKNAAKNQRDFRLNLQRRKAPAA